MALLLSACAAPVPIPAKKPPIPSAQLPSALPPLPDPLAGAAQIGTPEGHYVFYGLAPEAARPGRTAFVYRTRLGLWRSLPAVPVDAGRTGAAAAALSDRLYLFGGRSTARDGTPRLHKDLLVFDPATGDYARRADAPLAVADPLLLAYGERYLYAIGGEHSSGPVRTVQVYDALLDSWFAAEDFPGSPVYGAAGGLIGDRILLADGAARLPASGGGSRIAVVPQLWLAEINPDDPSILRWQKLPDHPGQPVFRAAAGALPGLDWVVLAGGSAVAHDPGGRALDRRKAQPLDQTVIVDLTARQARLGPLRPYASYDHGPMMLDRGRLYSVGGRGPDGGITPSVLPVPLPDEAAGG